MKFFFVLSCLISCIVACLGNDYEYNIGVGRSDVTGPAAEVNMMGYAKSSQTTKGIHLRLFSRAFIFEDNTKTRVVFVSVDAAMASQIMKIEVVKKLQKLYGKLYTEQNVCISGTHTHSGPAGYHQYVLFGVTSLGFIKESLDAFVDGIVQSIVNAHKTMRPANIYINTGELLNSNINRSPTAYLNNPAEERAKYKYDVDKTMTVLKIVGQDNKPIGMISWFPVHCTSMNNTNRFISSDNKGYASLLFERDFNKDSIIGEGSFVAAFAQSHEGDVSPNTKGAHCQDTGKPCQMSSSTCGGKAQKCVASGPGKDMFDSTRIIAENQYKKALELFRSASKKLSGPVDFKHQNVDMTKVKVILNKTTVETCRPAMGFSFAAGTTDGPGEFSFTQGDTSGNKFWKFVSSLLSKPSKEDKQCHSPKPILLNTGAMWFPYKWQPDVAETQIFRVGQMAIIAAPGEFTTMSGRRLMTAVNQVLVQNGLPKDTFSVVAGLSNTYTDYIATYEEYQIQRYEGASTIYGPHTLDAYIQTFKGLAKALAKKETLEAGPAPPNLLSKQVNFNLPVVYDGHPIGKTFGSILEDVKSSYLPGSQVRTVFVTGNPRNDNQLGVSFLYVEKQKDDRSWQVMFTDADWETKYEWKRTSSILGRSSAILTWDIPETQAPGTYRIRHVGHAKPAFQGVFSFTGLSSTFKIVQKKRRGLKEEKLAFKSKRLKMENEIRWGEVMRK